MNKADALDQLLQSNHDALARDVYESYKEIYGVNGPHVLEFTHAELVSWIVEHYEWDAANNFWDLKRDVQQFVDECNDELCRWDDPEPDDSPITIH